MKRITFALIVTGLTSLGIAEATSVNAAPAAKDPVGATATKPVAQIAKAHGLDQWHQVTAIAFTFNVQKGERTVSRSWHWETHSNKVTFRPTEGEAVTYHRHDLSSLDEATGKIDHKFINDTFWLLLPLHLQWAKEASITDLGPQPLPLGDGVADHAIDLTYPSDGGGYTPGDRYVIYTDADWKILQWSFHRGSRDEASLVTTWQDAQTFGPLTLYTTRNNPDAGFRMTFTDIKVTIAD